MRLVIPASRYTEASIAPSRNLHLEHGEVKGVSIVAFDVASAGSAACLFCQRLVFMMLLVLVAM
jgi:hypothetical protein